MCIRDSNNRPQGGGYQGNSPQGGYQGGQGGYQGNRDNNRPQGGGYQGNRPQGGYGARPQGCLLYTSRCV